MGLHEDAKAALLRLSGPLPVVGRRYTLAYDDSHGFIEGAPLGVWCVFMADKDRVGIANNLFGCRCPERADWDDACDRGWITLAS